MAKLKLTGVSELKDRDTGEPIPYLEFRLKTDTNDLPTAFATITSEGSVAGIKQTIQTKVKQAGTISMFDYAVFQ